MNLIKPRQRKRPNVQHVLQTFHSKIGEDRIVTAVLETFELEKQTSPGAYSTGYPTQLVADRTRDFLAFAVELLSSAGAPIPSKARRTPPSSRPPSAASPNPNSRAVRIPRRGIHRKIHNHVYRP